MQQSRHSKQMRTEFSKEMGEKVTRAKDEDRKKAGDSRDNGDVTADASGSSGSEWPELDQVGPHSRIWDGTGPAEPIIVSS